MLDLLFLDIILFMCVAILSAGIVVMSDKGFLGIRLQKFLSVQTIGELLVSIFMVVGIIMLIINLFLVFINYFLCLGPVSIEPHCIIDKTTTASDPVRYWPSGTAQTWGIIGTAAALYRATPGSHRIKATTALGSLAITVPLNVWIHAVENPNGFNQLMFSWVQYKNTGVWPSNIPGNVGEQSIDQALAKNAVEAEAGVGASSNSSNFLPLDNNELWSMFSPENLIWNFMGLFKPVGVEGYFDDLVGQQLFITFLLISVVIGVIVLFTIYFLIQTMYNNKEFITKRFDNRIIRLYIKYQFILSKISLFVLPILIFVGLIELFVGLHFLLTHPIPFELLPIDLHTYLKKN